MSSSRQIALLLHIMLFLYTICRTRYYCKLFDVHINSFMEESKLHGEVIARFCFHQCNYYSNLSRLLEEINEVVGERTGVTNEDMEKLTYMEQASLS